MSPVVDGIGKENPGKIEAKLVPQDSPEGRAGVAAAGFEKHHGLVVQDASGKVVFTYDGHDIPEAQVRAEAAKALR